MGDTGKKSTTTPTNTFILYFLNPGNLRYFLPYTVTYLLDTHPRRSYSKDTGGRSMRQLWYMLMAVVTFFILASTIQAGEVFTWNGSPGATAYVIYNSDRDTIKHNITSGTEYSVSDMNLAPGVPYDVWVRAYNTAGISGDSNHVEHTPSVFTITEDPRELSIVIPTAVTITIKVSL